MGSTRIIGPVYLSHLFSFRLLPSPLLDESSERRQSSARPDHDDWRLRPVGQAELRATHVNRNFVELVLTGAGKHWFQPRRCNTLSKVTITRL